MQQTLLALLGVIILALYGYSFQSRSAADERVSVRRELETAALGVATDWSARIQRFPFDQKTIGLRRPLPETDTTVSSDPSTFGASEEMDRCLWNDIDDFHGFSQRELYGVRFGEAAFDVNIAFRYANPDSLAQSVARSHVKVATITATYVEPEPLTPTFNPPVRARLDVVLSSAVLTVQQEMRRYEISRADSSGAGPADMTGSLVFSGC